MSGRANTVEKILGCLFLSPMLEILDRPAPQQGKIQLIQTEVGHRSH
jgi:hypothetical protein